MKSFYVINENINNKDFEPYDVMPYLVEQYEESSNKPTTKEEFKQFVKSESRYQWWSRCQYEIIITDWPNQSFQKKWDIHKQVMMNIDTVVDILMENVNENK